VQVRGVEHDAGGASDPLGLVEEGATQRRDAIGVGALECVEVPTRHISDGGRRDEWHACHGYGQLVDLEVDDLGNGHEPEATWLGEAGKVVQHTEEGRRIVVTAQHDRRRCLRQAAEGLHSQIECLIRRPRSVEEVARVQDQVGRLHIDEREEALERRGVIGLTDMASEASAEVPIGGVEELHSSGRGPANEATFVAMLSFRSSLATLSMVASSGFVA